MDQRFWMTISAVFLVPVGFVHASSSPFCGTPVNSICFPCDRHIPGNFSCSCSQHQGQCRCLHDGVPNSSDAIVHCPQNKFVFDPNRLVSVYLSPEQHLCSSMTVCRYTVTGDDSPCGIPVGANCLQESGICDWITTYENYRSIWLLGDDCA